MTPDSRTNLARAESHHPSKTALGKHKQCSEMLKSKCVCVFACSVHKCMVMLQVFFFIIIIMYSCIYEEDPQRIKAKQLQCRNKFYASKMRPHKWVLRLAVYSI